MNPLFAYMTVLAVIQPARVQDIERAAAHVLPASMAHQLSDGAMRSAHEEARNAGLVLTVRRGVYVLSRTAWSVIRTQGLQRELDNRRIFLIKSQRRRFNSRSGTV